MNIHKHAITYASGAVICSILLGMSLHLAGFVMSPWNYLSYAIFTAILVFAVKNWREKARGGYLTYGQAYGYSVWMSLYYSLLVTVWAFVFFQYIAHDEIVRYQSEEMARRLAEAKEKYHLTDEMIEQQVAFGKKLSTPGMLVVISLVGNMVTLCLINLITVAFLKKDKPVATTPFPPPTA